MPSLLSVVSGKSTVAHRAIRVFDLRNLRAADFKAAQGNAIAIDGIFTAEEIAQLLFAMDPETALEQQNKNKRRSSPSQKSALVSNVIDLPQWQDWLVAKLQEPLAMAGMSKLERVTFGMTKQGGQTTQVLQFNLQRLGGLLCHKLRRKSSAPADESLPPIPTQSPSSHLYPLFTIHIYLSCDPSSASTRIYSARTRDWADMPAKPGRVLIYEQPGDYFTPARRGVDDPPANNMMEAGSSGGVTVVKACLMYTCAGVKKPVVQKQKAPMTAEQYAASQRQYAAQRQAQVVSPGGLKNRVPVNLRIDTRV